MVLAVLALVLSATYALWALAVRALLDRARHQAGYTTKYTRNGPCPFWEPQLAARRRQWAGWKLLVILIAVLVIILAS